ncbi:MAG: hypothetical protein CMO40_09975 [Verrucomicrobiaceae bacterium]|nr:hypothetical protein [Verrucomicrobiaceae bacterium]
MVLQLIIRIPFAALLTTGLLVFGMVNGRAQAAELEKVEFDQASLEDLIDFLREGATGKTRNVLVDPRVNREISVTMTLHNVTKGVAFAYAAELGGFDYREERHVIRIIPRLSKLPVKAFLKRGRPVVERRAAGIIMPKVDFDETELRQVIRDLAAASRQLDPRKLGLNLLLGPGVDPETPVTLELQNIPMTNVLKYVGDFARVDIRVDGQAIIFLKRQKAGKR